MVLDVVMVEECYHDFDYFFPADLRAKGVQYI